MATKLFTGYSRTDRQRLPEEVSKLNPKNVVHAACIGGVMRAIKTGDYSNTSNMLNLVGAVDVQDETATSTTVIGYEEACVLQSPDGHKQEVSDPKLVELFRDEGWKLVGVVKKEIKG